MNLLVAHKRNSVSPLLFEKDQHTSFRTSFMRERE